MPSATADIPKHKVFISYHHHEEDEGYKNKLVDALNRRAIDKSVSPGDIHPEQILTDEIRRRIRNDHIAGAEVTIVLIGECTWQRKHVDWEISASLIHRRRNPRNGLMGLLLPSHPDYDKDLRELNKRRIPPRLADNIGGNDPFAVIYKWPKSRGVGRKMLSKINRAFHRRLNSPWPDDSLRPFAENWTGDCVSGWQSNNRR